MFCSSRICLSYSTCPFYEEFSSLSQVSLRSFSLLKGWNRFHWSDIQKIQHLNHKIVTKKLNDGHHTYFLDIFGRNITVSNSQDGSATKVKGVDISSHVVLVLNSNTSDPTFFVVSPSGCNQNQGLFKKKGTKTWAVMMRLIIS